MTVHFPYAGFLAAPVVSCLVKAEIMASRTFEPFLEARSTAHTFAQIERDKQLSGCYFRMIFG
jgi:hypothetical protein